MYNLLLHRFRTSIGDKECNHVVATNHPHTMDEVRTHLPLPSVVATDELLESEPLENVYQTLPVLLRPIMEEHGHLRITRHSLRFCWTMNVVSSPNTQIGIRSKLGGY